MADAKRNASNDILGLCYFSGISPQKASVNENREQQTSIKRLGMHYKSEDEKGLVGKAKSEHRKRVILFIYFYFWYLSKYKNTKHNSKYSIVILLNKGTSRPSKQMSYAEKEQRGLR